MFVLTACNSKLEIIEMKSVPNDLQKVLEQLGMNSYVQVINDGRDISYIVINTKDTVMLSVENNDDTISVDIEEVEGQNENIDQHIYKLTRDRDYEYFQLYKNGEGIPVDVVTGM